MVRELGQAVATSERWIEGTFWRRARVEGNDIGYGSICAAGPHATTLHWVRNDGDVRPGELLLLDAGVETHTLYTADVTRTLPINGDVQRAAAQDLRRRVRRSGGGHRGRQPGRPFRDFHDAAQRVLAEHLLEWGLLPRCPTSRRSWSSACSAAGPCTAPATCSAWTSTTAPTRAPSYTPTPRWCPAWC